uniref:UMA domain-containing protein n=1 Tax=Strongyloides papillosus TaxID=174720 RepID=A0A0N5CGL1_STREA
MANVKKGKLTLKPNETFEIYEHRRAASPKNIMSRDTSTSNGSLGKIQYYYPNKDQSYFSPHVDNHNQINDYCYNIRMPVNIPPKRKFPLVWVIAAAISIPLFIILCMFVAVWLQELGFLK